MTQSPKQSVENLLNLYSARELAELLVEEFCSDTKANALRQKLEQAEMRYSELDEKAGALSMAIVHELTDKQYAKISGPFAALQDCLARHRAAHRMAGGEG